MSGWERSGCSCCLPVCRRRSRLDRSSTTYRSVVAGSYDEHLVRDVGVLFLALIIVTLWAAWHGEFPVPVSVAWLVQGVGHLPYHVGHLDGPAGVDRVGLVGHWW